MPPIFADLHCHPTLYGFNHARNTPDEADPDRYHPWYVPPSDVDAMDAAQRATSYAQIDFPKMTLAGVRLVFASITPIEVGFFRGNPERDKNTSFFKEALKLASGTTALRGALALLQQGPQAALHEVTAILRNEGPLRVLIQRLVLKYSEPRIRFMMSGPYDYWDEFLKEYNYLAARDGDWSEATVEYMDSGVRKSAAAAGTYHIARDAEHLQAVMAGDDIAVILSIEGGHTFTIGPDQERVATPLIFERIDALKALPHPIFFITLAHHFDNGVCGHAHSIPDAGRLVMNQTRRMNAGLERQDELGARVIRALLDLDDDLRDGAGRRILIDAKHMSPRSRKAYYAEIVEPYNAARAADAPRQPIPVLFSHAAWAGVPALDDLIAAEDRESDTWHIGVANAWGINLADEDVRMAHRSGGLIGLVFDQRILGVRPGQKTDDDMLHTVVMQQIFGLVDAVLLDDTLPADRRHTAWDIICLGTDYDGVIDPISCYPTALALPRFATDLRAWLDRYRHTRHIDAIGVDNLVEKICWRNAWEFTQRHFPAACGQ